MCLACCVKFFPHTFLYTHIFSALVEVINRMRTYLCVFVLTEKCVSQSENVLIRFRLICDVQWDICMENIKIYILLSLPHYAYISSYLLLSFSLLKWNDLDKFYRRFFVSFSFPPSTFIHTLMCVKRVFENKKKTFAEQYLDTYLSMFIHWKHIHIYFSDQVKLNLVIG